MITFSKILCLVPHTDDEILCSGLMSKSNADIKIIAFSHPPEIIGIVDEFRRSCSLITKEGYVELLDYPIRNLCSWRQEILELMHEESKNNYDCVLCPASFDTHQDHHVIYSEARRAFKNTTILGYQSPHNDFEGKYNLFVRLTEKEIDLKEKMISCYESQRDRYYFKNNMFRKLAEVNGTLVGKEFCEMYEVIRLHG